MNRVTQLLKLVGRNHMPLFRTLEWNGYKVKTTVDDNNIIRSFDLFRLIPYFWDSEVSFDLMIRPPMRDYKFDDTWGFRWELRDLDNNLIKQNQEGTLLLMAKDKKRSIWLRKARAISLGYLKPGQQYLLNTYLTNSLYGKSPPCVVAFTVKDRDEYYIQLLILLIGIGFSFILWMMSGGAR